MAGRDDGSRDVFEVLFGSGPDLFGSGPDLFDGRNQVKGRQPPPEAASMCLARASAALGADPGDLKPRLGAALESASLALLLVEDPIAGAVTASVVVHPADLQLVRQHTAEIRAELEPVVAHAGWNLVGVSFVADAPEAPPEPMRPPKRLDVVAAIANAVASEKSYDVDPLCDRLGFPPHPDPNNDPHSGKAGHVRGRLGSAELPELVALGVKVLDEIDDAHLEVVIAHLQLTGPGGAPVKNVIFGSTAKPDLVLADALDNHVGLLNPDDALFLDGGIPPEGLSMSALVKALLPAEAAEDLHAAAKQLHKRLVRCLGSEPEKRLFHAYARRYKILSFDEPALLPQVWVHYDPRSVTSRHRGAVFSDFRKDFMLLLPGSRRIVLEVDGHQHYSSNGKPSPRRYGEMAAGDRELRLAGYEVFRFGGAELPGQEAANALLDPFFDRLLER